MRRDLRRLRRDAFGWGRVVVAEIVLVETVKKIVDDALLRRREVDVRVDGRLRRARILFVVSSRQEWHVFVRVINLLVRYRLGSFRCAANGSCLERRRAQSVVGATIRRSR